MQGEQIKDMLSVIIVYSLLFCDYNKYVTSDKGQTTFIGERREASMGRWMENFVLPRMPVCWIYVPYVHNRVSTEDFTVAAVARLVNDEENVCR